MENSDKHKPSIKVSFNLDENTMDIDQDEPQQQPPQQQSQQVKPEVNLKASVRLYNKIISSVGANSVENNTENTLLYPRKNESISYRYKKKHYYLKEFKQSTYMMLEKPTGRLAFLHRLFTFSIILLTILFSAFTTMKKYSEWAENSLFFIELFVTVYFFIEYLLRVWSCDCRPLYRGLKGKIKCMLRPIMIIELLAFIFGVILIIGSSRTLSFSDSSSSGSIFNKIANFGDVPLTILRFLQLVRLLYVDRKAHTWIILYDVCYKHKFELIASVYIGFVTLLFSSYLIYHCEKSHNDSFHTYSDAVYWAIITMTTIGYGDISPKTFYGKIIATGLCVLGVAFWTLPGGIIGSGFAFKIEQRNKIKKFNRLVPAAAYLIQAWWRTKVILDIPTSNTTRLISVLKAFDPSSANDNTANGSKSKLRDNEINDWFHNIDKRQGGTGGGSDEENAEDREVFIKEARRKEQESQNLYFVHRKLRPETIVMLRTILYLRFFVAKNKFKFAHKPYDFKDVIEQYTKGNMDILIKIKDLQRKLDQTTNINSRNSLSPATATTTTTLRQQRLMSRQLSFIESTTLLSPPPPSLSRDHSYLTLEHRIESIENKLDQLINLFNSNNNNNNNSRRSSSRNNSSGSRREDDIIDE